MEGESPFRRHVAWGLCCVGVSGRVALLRAPQQPERERPRLGHPRRRHAPRAATSTRSSANGAGSTTRPRTSTTSIRARRRARASPACRCSWVPRQAAPAGGLAAAGQARDDVLAAPVRGQAAAVRVPAAVRALRAARDRFQLGARRRRHRAGAGDDAVPVRQHVRRACAGGGGGVQRVHPAG